MVERREAQRSGRRASHPRHLGRARPQTGFATRAWEYGARAGPIARHRHKGSRKPLAPPGAPFPFRKTEGTEKGDRRTRRLSNNTGGGALAFSFLQSGDCSLFVIAGLGPAI